MSADGVKQRKAPQHVDVSGWIEKCGPKHARAAAIVEGIKARIRTALIAERDLPEIDARIAKLYAEIAALQVERDETADRAADLSAIRSQLDPIAEVLP